MTAIIYVGDRLSASLAREFAADHDLTPLARNLDQKRSDLQILRSLDIMADQFSGG